MKKVRLDRIEEEIRKELSVLIQQEMKDPRVDGLVSITDVEVTNDLSYAKVFITRLGQDNDNDEVIKVLNKAKGFFRSELSQRIDFRTIPELFFEFDRSIEYGNKIENILNSLKKEQDLKND